MARWAESEKPWERQPGESAQAYEAFHAYLKMGSDRSLRKVAQQLGKSNALISRWSSTWSWQNRVKDYIAEQNRKELEEQQEAIKKMRKRQAQTAVVLQKKAYSALDKLDITKLEPRDILRFITEGAKLEREANAAAAADFEAVNGDKTTHSIADEIIDAYESRKRGEKE